MTRTEQGVARAGRGGLAVLAAKVFFILTGLVQQALLPRLTSQADYGALSRVLAVSNVLNNLVVASSTQGVSRTVAAAGAAERRALRAVLRVHLVLALAAAALLAVSAPFLVHFQHAPDMLAPLLTMTFVLGAYGLYAPLVGYLNGRAQFTKQAALDMIAATLRTIGLLGCGYLFMRHAVGLAAALGTSPGVLGAAVGAGLAVLGVFVVAVTWTGWGEKGSGIAAGVPTARVYVALIVPVMVAQLFTNGLMQADIFVLGRYLSLDAEAAHLTDHAKVANEWVAAYRACQLFAFLPYQLLFSVTQVLFPMLARAKAEEGPARVAELVRRGSRIGAIVCGMLVTVIVAMPYSLLDFAYGAKVAGEGMDALHVLGIGQGAFAMLGLATTILVSLGRERDAMALTAVGLLLLVGSCVVTIPAAGFGEAKLVATAVAVTGALFLTLAVAAVRVRQLSGAFVPLKTALRVTACIGAAFVAGKFLPHFGKLLTPVVATVLVGGYLVVLVVTGELGKDDLSLALSVANRQRGRNAAK